MSTVKKDQLTATSEWRKHLRQLKRIFWKGERQAARKSSQRQVSGVGREKTRGPPMWDAITVESASED